MSIGEGAAGTGFATMRGRDYPTIRQFTVFLENRVGQLLGSHSPIRRLARADRRSFDQRRHASAPFVRFLLSHPEQGREILDGRVWPSSKAI